MLLLCVCLFVTASSISATAEIGFPVVILDQSRSGISVSKSDPALVTRPLTSTTTFVYVPAKTPVSDNPIVLPFLVNPAPTETCPAPENCVNVKASVSITREVH